ncbi:Aerobic glycerol-3-phosphate dehydrogenase [compost metagenome]
MSSVQALVDSVLARHSWLAADIVKRWALTYGSRVWQLLDGVQGPDDLGQAIGGGLFSREVEYLCREEWANDANDILWRRTKLGLFLTATEQQALATCLEQASVKRHTVRAA